jgi:hypothetical protein
MLRINTNRMKYRQLDNQKYEALWSSAPQAGQVILKAVSGDLYAAGDFCFS